MSCFTAATRLGCTSQELLARSSSADTKAPTQLSNEPSLDISFGMVAHAQTHPSATAAGEVAPSPPTATEAGGQQATSTLQAPQASALDTAEDVRPRLAGMKRSFEMARTTSFSFPILTQPPQAAPRAGGEKKGKIQYDRMRELETHVQQIRQVGDALRQAVRRADQQVRQCIQGPVCRGKGLCGAHANPGSCCDAHRSCLPSLPACSTLRL